jgi:predicted naringenin-chalcone synthase
MTNAFLNRVGTAVLGFDLVLSGRVPSSVSAGLPSCVNDVLNGGGVEDFLHWVVHPGALSWVLWRRVPGFPRELLVQSRETANR